MTTGHALRWILSLGVKPRLEAELLLSHVLKCRREDLYINWNRICPPRVLQKAQALSLFKKAGAPTAYILGQKEFYKHVFYVEPGVFIPRPETETLIDAAADQFKNKNQKLNIVDLGSGSGCVGLSLLKIFPKAVLTAVDLSAAALKAGSQNAASLKVDNRAVFLKKDAGGLNKKDLPPGFKRGVDMITANPPYVAYGDPKLDPAVAHFEPAAAVFSGQNGEAHIRSWLKTAERLLSPGGFYFFEIGAGQKKSLKNLRGGGCKVHFEYKDLLGITRVMSFRYG